MQVSATLIAAQQAAREAQAKFQAAHVAPKQSAAAESFTAALGDFSQGSKPATAPAAPAAPQQNAPAARMGSLLDITI
jgi:hypothetical protein